MENTLVLQKAQMALRSYLSELQDAKVLKPEVSDCKLNSVVRFFDISQIVIDKNENMQDKLSNVFQAVWNAKGSLLFYINGNKEKAQICLGIKNISQSGDENSIIDHTYFLSDLLQNNLKANFPGTKLELVKEDMLENISQDISKADYVACVSDVATSKGQKDESFIQGIEKLIETMQNKEYSMLLVADPIDANDLEQAKFALENLYSSLVPHSKLQYSYGENESYALSQSLAEATTDTITKSVNASITHTSCTSKSETEALNLFGGLASLIRKIPYGGGVVASFISNGASTTTSQTETESKAETKSESESKSDSITKTMGETDTKGSSTNLQTNFENYGITRSLKKIEATLDRYDECSDVGMWNCAVYCISSSDHISLMAANTYQSLIRGKSPSLQNGRVIRWSEDKSKEILKYLKNMQHPKFDIDSLEVTPGVVLSSLELALQAGLPKIDQLPVCLW